MSTHRLEISDNQRQNIARDSGFTLIEMLVALFIFSLISVGTLSAMTSALRGKAQIETRLDSLQQIETARALIRADISNIILRENRDSLGQFLPTTLSGGVDTLLTFTRVGRVNPGGLEPRGDIQRVHYVFEDGALIRRALSEENPTQTTDFRDRVLIENLQNVQISFLSGRQDLRQIEIASQLSSIRSGTITGGALQAIRLELEFNTGQTLTQLFEVSL